MQSNILMCTLNTYEVIQYERYIYFKIFFVYLSYLYYL